MPDGKADAAVSDEGQPAWVSQRAVAWALDDAPCPVELLPALIAVARRCDENGKGSRQAVGTIGLKIGKSKKQTQRDLAKLREIGLLVLGDQSLVEHLPPWQRPTVYDVPLHVTGVKPVRESKNPTGAKRPTPIHGGTPLDAAPPMQGVRGAPMDGGTPPPMDGVQNNPLNNPKEQPSLSARELAAARPVEPEPDRERDESVSSSNQDLPHRLLAAQGVTGEEADSVIEAIRISNSVRGDGFWRTVDRNGDLPGLIEQARANSASASASAWPEWCGECDQNRQIQMEGGYGQGIVVARCPRCHPANQASHLGQSTASRRAEQALRVADELDREAGQRGPYRNPRDHDAYDDWIRRRPPGLLHRDPPDRRPVIEGVLSSQVLTAESEGGRPPDSASP